jgi:hypothetical protein
MEEYHNFFFILKTISFCCKWKTTSILFNFNQTRRKKYVGQLLLFLKKGRQPDFFFSFQMEENVYNSVDERKPKSFSNGRHPQ